MTRRESTKQLALFLLMCIGFTSLNMLIAYKLDPAMQSIGAKTLYQLACFVPAISALVAIFVFKIRVRKLKIFPHFQTRAKAYIIALVFGLLLCLVDYPILIKLFPEAIWFNKVDVVELVFQILLYIAICAILTFVSMGEEIGWLGFVYPRLEKIGGVTFGIIAMGIVRGCWHLPLIIALEKGNVWEQFFSLTLSNILLGSVLVLVTKLSDSIIPGAFIHCMTNTLPTIFVGVVMTDELAYAKCADSIELVKILISAVLGIVAYAVLVVYEKKKKQEVLKTDEVYVRT